MSETQIPIATLRTKQIVQKIRAVVANTAPANAKTTSKAETFVDSFVGVPDVIGVVCVDSAAIKANVGCVAVNATGLTVSMYQVLAADLITGNYNVDVTVVGWKAA
jgi:hypothetical protein